MRSHFFVVEVDSADEDRSFVDIFHEVAALKAAARTTQVWRDSDEMRLENDRASKKNAGVFGGDLVRIRMTEIPGIIGTAGGTSEIDLEDDEGISEETAFLYVHKWRVLAVQSNRGGPSPSAIASYFSKLNPKRTAVYLTPVLNLAQLEQLKEIERFTKVEVAMAVPQDRLASLQPPKSVAGMIDAGDELKAPRMHVTFSVGHAWKKKSLLKEAVLRCVRFLARRGDDITNLVVSGRSESDENVALDMMKARLVFEAPVTLTGRRAPADARRNFLFAAMRAHEDLLESAADDE